MASDLEWHTIQRWRDERYNDVDYSKKENDKNCVSCSDCKCSDNIKNSENLTNEILGDNFFKIL